MAYSISSTRVYDNQSGTVGGGGGGGPVVEECVPPLVCTNVVQVEEFKKVESRFHISLLEV